MLWAWLVGGVIALSMATLAVGASIAVVRSKTLGPSEKIRRLLLAWLLPLAGPIVVLHRLQHVEPEVIPRELVAASGLGWGVLGDARRGARDGSDRDGSKEASDRERR